MGNPQLTTQNVTINERQNNPQMNHQGLHCLLCCISTSSWRANFRTRRAFRVWQGVELVYSRVDPILPRVGQQIVGNMFYFLPETDHSMPFPGHVHRGRRWKAQSCFPRRVHPGHLGEFVANGQHQA